MDFSCRLYASMMSSGIYFTGIFVYSKQAKGVFRQRFLISVVMKRPSGIEMTELQRILKDVRSEVLVLLSPR